MITTVIPMLSSLWLSRVSFYFGTFGPCCLRRSRRYHCFLPALQISRPETFTAMILEGQSRLLAPRKSFAGTTELFVETLDRAQLGHHCHGYALCRRRRFYGVILRRAKRPPQPELAGRIVIESRRNPDADPNPTIQRTVIYDVNRIEPIEDGLRQTHRGEDALFGDLIRIC